MAGRIELHGLREFRSGLRKLDKSLPRGLRVAANKAADIVVREAIPRVPVGPGNRGHASSSIKARSSQSAVRVAEGGARFPYMPWLDFGGAVNKHTAHPTVRPFLKKGRYIWAAFADNQEAVERELLDALADVARDAGLRVR